MCTKTPCMIRQSRKLTHAAVDNAKTLNCPYKYIGYNGDYYFFFACLQYIIHYVHNEITKRVMNE